MSRMRYALLAVVAALVWALTASPAQAAKTVVIDSVDTPASVFQPANVTVEVGDTVRWEFDQASTTHTVKSQGTNWAQPIDELRGPNGAPINRTFTTPGTYNFLCDVHNGMTGSVTVEAPKLERVLVFSKTGGFRHDSIPQGIAAIQALGTANGFTVVATEDAAQFTAANLATFDVVVFMSTTGEILNAAQQTAFENYIKAGGGFAGVHAASDTEYEWPWFGELVGGYFRSHPPGTPTADVKIEAPNEPSTAGLPATWTRTDEWYNFQHPTTPAINGNSTIADYSPRARHVKVLATVDEATYDEQDGNTENDDHPIAWCSNFDGGRSWYTGMGHTQASFSDPQFRAHLLGGLRTAAGVAGDCGEPRSMPPTADDFEKITINNDTNAPMEIDIANDGRAFYIELDGRVQMWNPTTRTTTMVGDLRNAVTLSHENGLLGIQLAKDFDTSGHIYLAYSALPDAAGINRVSRFTLTGNTLGQEQIIYTWQHQRQECCHTGGSLEWGANGDLYISTGDNTNPFAHGFNPTDERPGRQIWDAQRTSGNTNDPNGKILRIRPIPNATGAPGVGSTYTIPPGNLFPVGTAQTLPEIYAMGFRNPFRINYDPKTGWITMGDYGPDAGSTDPNRGPQGSVEWNVVKGPGNYGWPYCIRQNVAYKDITYTSNAGGTVKGDYSCTNPVNDSPNNTGLTNLPPAIPATMWTGYSELDTRFPDIGGGGAPTGGPIYRYNEASDSDRKFPKFFDGQLFMGEWNNDWIKTATLNDQGLATGVSNWAVTTGYISPMDIEFGPDGSLYVVEWGQGFAENNPDSGVYRIDYISGSRTPIANATVDNDAVPVGTEVQFSSAGSNDPDGTQISYLWNFGDGSPTSTEANPKHRYTAAGNYSATLTVTDESGASAVDTVLVVVGNQRPVVTIEVPENGKVADFGDKVHYKVSVTDPDGGSTGAGTISCSDIRIEVKLGHDSHAHELFTPTGCEGDFVVTSVDGHGVNANVFTVITAAYTDKGNGPAQGVTGSAEAILQPKLKQAEYFDTTGRTPDSRATEGTPGVELEATTDVNGGNAAAFVEDGDWISFNPYNLEDLTDVTFRVASGGAGGIIELRYDSATGPLVAATPLIAPTGGWQTWQDVKLALPATIPQGTHRLFIVFRHPTATGSLMNLNWFKFAGKGGAVTAPPIVDAKAEPLTGQAPLNVAFDVDATDPEGGALTYAWDFGVPGTEADKSTQKSPNYTYTTPGNYTATVTVSDPDGGHASDTVEIRVTRPLDECPTGPVRSDEFDGNTLDSKWTVERPDAANPLSVSGGNLNLPISNGSMYGAGTTAKNIVVQDMPDGEWTATAKISASALSENYHQAGLRVWAGDDNWASVHMIYAGSGRDIEFITETNGNPRNEGADKLGGIPADAPLDYYVRIISDGQNLTAAYSYNGTTFTPVGRPVSLATFTNPKIGPAALSDQAATTPVARFDWVRFEPDGSGGGGSEGIVDNFDGTTLDAAWDRIRPDQSAVVGSGTLQIPAQAGDIYQTRNDAKNLIVRTAPNGAWVATTKLSFKGTAQYHQAGIMVYGDDNNFTKFGRIAHSTAGDEKFEFINEVNAVARNEAADSTANIGAAFPNDFYLRLTSDGTNVTGHYSTDGTTWTPAGRPAVLPANAKIGLFAFSNDGAGNPVAAFDSFTLTGDNVGGGGGGGGGTPSGPSYDDQFDGATLDKTRWNAIVRDNPAEYSLSGGKFNLTLTQGDIYTGDTTPPPNGFILQDSSHAGEDWVIETKIDDYTHDGGYAQGGLIAYLNGDNYVKFDVITDPNNARANRIELRSEVAGAIQNPQANLDLTAANNNGPFWLRLTKTGSSYSGEVSFDGVAWTPFPQGPVTNPMASPDFGIFGFSPQEAGVGDRVTFDYFTLNGEDPSSCEQCDGPGDDFAGSALSPSRWNAIAHDDPTKYKVDNGNLVVTTTAGEIYQTSTGGGPLILQAADHAGTDYVLETKLTNTLDGGYSQGGIMVYGDDNNYVKLNAISDDNNANRVNRLELRSEVNGTVSATPSDPQITQAQAAGPLWLRLTKAGNSYTAEYKTSEAGPWTAFSGPVTNAMVAPKFGLYTQGVLQSGDTVTFEYFSVNGDSTGCPPENTAPSIESVTATPTSGFAPLQVKFDITASDEDDDALTYSWDFDGDGDEDSSAEDPTHTYTAAGTYEAEVTVSDGTDERTRKVTVTVFGADDPEARFRVLVFSKTTGFRHDSIPAGIAAIRALGQANDFQVDATEDAGVFNATALAHYDAVVFMSTTGDPLNATQQTAFENYIRAGGGYVGVHAAADTEYEWPFYGQLVGAYFQSHPAGTPTATVRVDDPDHHSTTGLPNPWQRVDEWYNYQSPVNPVVGGGGADYSPRGKVHVLLTVDEATYDEGDGNTTDDDHPISWCQRYEGGRSWYTGMGHTQATFSEPDFLKHLLGGLEIASGAVADADCGTTGGTNRPPVVEAVRTPGGDVSPGDPIEFKATATDPDGDELTYEWDFGDGAKADTATAIHAYTKPGLWYAKVTVRDGKGGRTEKLLQVAVQPHSETEEEVGVGGLVPGVMGLEITGSANLGLFQPGVAKDYTATLSAVATSTSSAAELTVYDRSTTATGRLVNGTHALVSPVQVNADGGAYKPVPASTTSRASLVKWTGPFSGKALTIGFKQSIAANEQLVTGGYGKVLTFTLSPTTP